MEQANDIERLIADTLQPMQSADPITASLEFVREHLGMEVAYLSEFVGEDLVFRAVSAPGFEDMVQIGGAIPLEQVYCRHILAGRLPEVIPDTADYPLCADIAITQSLPIGSHVSVPVLRQDGTPYGMFCCLSRTPQRGLNDRDLSVTRAFASISANQINTTLDDQTRRQAMEEVIGTIIRDCAYDIVYQPIKSVATQKIVGYEALCRFQAEPYRAPNLWFDDALYAGMQIELELRVIEKALIALDYVPDDIYVSVNASPDTVSSGSLIDVLGAKPIGRVVLEITEHSQAADYDLFIAEVAKLRAIGIVIAIDDAGAGYSGLQHIVNMRPEIIKLDISLTSSIDTDVIKRSLGAALVTFGSEIGAKIVAEGVESLAELETLRALNVPLAQGYFLDRPMPFEQIADSSQAVA